MAISRAQLVKELEPGLNALFGLGSTNNTASSGLKFSTLNHLTELSKKEVMLAGFANAAVKPEGQGVGYDDAQETFTARYTNETMH